jgi:hypothetical protein
VSVCKSVGDVQKVQLFNGSMELLGGINQESVSCLVRQLKVFFVIEFNPQRGGK